MKVLLLGANGYLGPHVVAALAPHHALRITDIKPPPAEVRQQQANQDFRRVDVTVAAEVEQAARGMDAIVNLSVVRTDRVKAFQVNALGCLNVMRAAVKWGISRVINTGPHFTIAGPDYEGFDFGIDPDVPPHPGTNLYALTKSLGHDVCRTFTRQYPVWVLELLFYSLREPRELVRGSGGVPFVVSWPDAASAFRLALEVDNQRLPSRFEVFFILGRAPQGKFREDKARRVLGFEPRDVIEGLWKK